MAADLIGSSAARHAAGRAARGKKQASTEGAARAADRSKLFDEGFLKKLEYLHMVSRKVFTGNLRADRRTRKVGSGIEFADHRTYARGDDFRYIDWNVYGRVDKLLLRLFEEEEDLHIYILLDCSTSMGLGRPRKLRYAVEIAAALAYVGLANLDRVGLTCMSRKVHTSLPAVRGKGRIFRVFEFLRGAPSGGATDLRAACSRLAAESVQPGLTVVLSDFYDMDGAFDGLNLLRFRKHEPVAIQILDPAEVHPERSALRGDVSLVDCEGGDPRDVTLSPATLRAYAAAHEQFCAALASNCRARGVPYFRAEIDVPFDELVLRMFRTGGLLR